MTTITVTVDSANTSSNTNSFVAVNASSVRVGYTFSISAKFSDDFNGLYTVVSVSGNNITFTPSVHFTPNFTNGLLVELTSPPEIALLGPMEFPANPEVGQDYVADNAVTYTWLGDRWSSAIAINAGTAGYYRDGGRANTGYFADTLDGGTA